MWTKAIERLSRLIDGPDVPDTIRGDLVALLYPRSFRIGTSILTSIVNGAVLAAIMGSWLPIWWMLLSLVICGFRALDWASYFRMRDQRTSAEWARRFTLRFIPFGVWWGMTASVLFISDDPLVMAIAVLSTDAQGAGAVCSYPGHPPAALAFILPAMIAFAIAGAIHGGVIGYSIVFVEIVLIANYIIIIREFFRSTVDHLVMQHEKSVLGDDLAEAHAALQREGRAKSEFLAHMSHELRTPLNAIMGFSDAMRAQYFGPLENSKYLEYLGDIHSSANHLLNIVSDVLDVARVEAGALTVQLEEIPASEITDFATRLVVQRAHAKRLFLDVTLDSQLEGRKLKTDAVRLRQVMINLLSNAIKFTDPGGTVRLSVGIQAEAAIFEVSDTGIGMSAEELEKALIPFAQVGSPLLAREGTGLGLPLARTLIEKLGGRFQIMSAPGIGTKVTITMPCLV
jgi:signal transduction histidine kinase